MKHLLTLALLFAALTASAQIRIHQLETVPVGRVISNTGTGNVFIDLIAANIGVTPPTGYTGTNQAALNAEFAADIDALTAGGSDGNNFTSSIAFTGTTTKTLTLGRDGLANLTANFTDLVDDADASPTNEAQTISAGGTTSPTIALSAVSGSGGGTITLAATGAASLSRSGNTITVNATDTNTQDGVAATAAFTGTTTKTLTLTRTNGLADLTATFTDNVDDADASATNEINNFTVTSNTNTVTGTNGGGTFSRVTDYHEAAVVIASSSQVVALPATPATLADAVFERNGVRVTASFIAANGYYWIDGDELKPGTGTPAFANGELITYKFPK